MPICPMVVPACLSNSPFWPNDQWFVPYCSSQTLKPLINRFPQAESLPSKYRQNGDDEKRPARFGPAFAWSQYNEAMAEI